MKKKLYEKPLMRAIEIKAESCLLTASGDPEPITTFGLNDGTVEDW